MLDPKKMTIIIDSREQTPLNFDLEKHKFTTEIAGLSTGDYSVKGFEHLIAIERKSLPDLVACVTKERDRFLRELQRLKSYPTKALIVECDWSEIFGGEYRSKTKATSVVGSLSSWVANFGIPLITCKDRSQCAEIAAKIMYFGVVQRIKELKISGVDI